MRKDWYQLIGFLKDKFKDNKKKDSAKKSKIESANQVSISFVPSMTNEELLLFKDFISKSNGMHFTFHFDLFYNNWIIDTGAFQHMTRNVIFLKNTPKYTSDQFVTIPSGNFSKVQGIGDITFFDNIFLKNVLFIPEFKVNLIAVNKLT